MGVASGHREAVTTREWGPINEICVAPCPRDASTERWKMTKPAALDPYTVLNVRPDASDSTISAAYRALARHHHPDIAGEAATSAMAKLNIAWELIGTNEARTKYDAVHGRRAGTGRRGGAAAEARSSWSTPAADGTGGAGRPPGRPSGSVLPFGRHIGWSLGEIARVDVGYLEWLEDRQEGQPYAEEIDQLLRQIGRRDGSAASASPRRGFRGRSRV